MGSDIHFQQPMRFKKGSKLENPINKHEKVDVSEQKTMRLKFTSGFDVQLKQVMRLQELRESNYVDQKVTVTEVRNW